MNSGEQIVHSFGVTKITGKEFKCIWPIHNFGSFKFQHGESVDSPIFSTNVDEDFLWKLELKYDQVNENCFSINLFNLSSGKVQTPNRICLTISLVDSDGKNILLVRENADTRWPSIFEDEYPVFLKPSYLYDEKNKLLINGTLTIKCTIFFFHGFVQESLSKSVQSNNSCNCNLKNLFETRKLSDVTLSVGTQEFKAHKCILAARSKVFSAMFEHNMKEKNSNTVEIDDIEPAVIQEMLHFIYCGKTDDFQDASNLLIAADKYQINKLRSACEDQLINDLNIDNVGKTLILADRYKIDTLKKRTIQFIVTHSKDINLEQFKNDVESYSPLLSDMLQAIM